MIIIASWRVMSLLGSLPNNFRSCSNDFNRLEMRKTLVFSVGEERAGRDTIDLTISGWMEQRGGYNLSNPWTASCSVDELERIVCHSEGSNLSFVEYNNKIASGSSRWFLIE